jgi:hypothetical protein
MDGRTIFQWTRNLLAIGGLAGCALVAVVATLVFWPRHSAPASAHSPVPKPTMEDASWLIDSAGLLEQRASLQLFDSGRHVSGHGEDDDDDAGAGFVDAWCLRGRVTVAANVHWLAPERLDEVLGEGFARALAAGHAQADCIPEAAVARERFLKVLPLRIELWHGRVQSASFALLDRDRGELYLVNATLLPPR